MEENYKEVISSQLKEAFRGECNRILIVNPPQIPKEDFDVSVARVQNYPCFPPYGPGLLCRNLQNRGYISDIIDLNYEVLFEANQKNDDFDYDFWKDVLKNKIDSFKPDLIGISCMYSMSHNSMKHVADFIKQINPELVIAAGGVHVSSVPKQVLENCKSIDAVMLYESDISFPNLLDVVNGKEESDILTQVAMMINNEYILVSERMVPTGEIINLSPEYHELRIENYSSFGKIGESRWLLPEGTKISTVLSNRGCRGSCSFCAVRDFNGEGVRQRSVKSVVDEIENLKNKYEIQHIMWLDDDLLFNKKRAIELFNEIVERNLDITWNASNGVIAASIDDELMKSVLNSGCTCLYIGIESGDEEILKSVKKPSGIRNFLNASKALKNYPDIFAKGFLMVGFPEETIGQINKTINLAREMALDWYAIQILTPFPSTQIANKLIEDGKWDNEHFIDGSAKFFVGGIGKQRVREQEEKKEAKKFENVLEKNQDHVPGSEELKDIWFLADYFTNYERILNETNIKKLRMKEGILREICEKKTKENPLGNLFLGVVQNKLGKNEESKKHISLAKEYMNNSAFWKMRFETLQLDKLIDKMLDNYKDCLN